MSDLANWQCKCGKGPSMDHSVGGYCSGRLIIEALESELSRVKEELNNHKDFIYGQYREYWEFGFETDEQKNKQYVYDQIIAQVMGWA